jgi:hypothetical protein
LPWVRIRKAPTYLAGMAKWDFDKLAWIQFFGDIVGAARQAVDRNVQAVGNDFEGVAVDCVVQSWVAEDAVSRRI